MRERPILFSGPMVRAILDGRKTQTRRVIKRDIREPLPPVGAYFDAYNHTAQWNWWTSDNRVCNGHCIIECPYGSPGDRLWVRETWCNINKVRVEPEYYYKADTFGAEDYDPSEWTWKPSIHMPRAASRITLELTKVRVQRVQEVSEDDARAEGMDWSSVGAPSWGIKGMAESWGSTAKNAFSVLWDSINAERGFGWDKNPWVWCLTFKRAAQAALAAAGSQIK